MSFRLTQRAQDDLREIRNWISVENPAAAVRVIDAIFETLQLLVRHPEVGAPYHNLGENLRAFPAQRPAQRYVIFFHVREETLVVMRVLHGARDFNSVFDQ